MSQPPPTRMSWLPPPRPAKDESPISTFNSEVAAILPDDDDDDDERAFVPVARDD